MQEIVLKVRYLERGLSRSLKKGNFIFFFRIQSLLMDKLIKNKRDLELETSRSSDYETSSEKIPLLVMY